MCYFSDKKLNSASILAVSSQFLIWFFAYEFFVSKHTFYKLRNRYILINTLIYIIQILRVLIIVYLTCHHNRLSTIPLTIIITESSKKLTYALISKIHIVGFIYLPSRFYIAKNKCTNWADDWKRGLCFKIHTKSASLLQPYLKNSKVRCL